MGKWIGPYNVGEKFTVPSWHYYSGIKAVIVGPHAEGGVLIQLCDQVNKTTPGKMARTRICGVDPKKSLEKIARLEKKVEKLQEKCTMYAIRNIAQAPRRDYRGIVRKRVKSNGS